MSVQGSVDLRGARKIYAGLEFDSSLFYHHWESIPWSELKGLLVVLNLVAMTLIFPIDFWFQYDVLPNDLLARKRSKCINKWMNRNKIKRLWIGFSRCSIISVTQVMQINCSWGSRLGWTCRSPVHFNPRIKFQLQNIK